MGGSTVAGVLGPGAGNVDIVNNLIQGNLAGSGSGGGIRAWAFNGTDVSAGGPATYELNLFNNMIVNNVAANSGGGVSLQDTAKVNIVNNTIADNDSTATAISTFAAGSANSTPQGAGLVGNYHSLVLRNALAAAGDPQTFANPRLEDSILWHNQSYYYDPTLNASRGGLVLNPAFPPNGYWDLQVAGTPAPQSLNPQYCVLSSTAGYAPTNVSTDPLFVREYDERPPLREGHRRGRQQHLRALLAHRLLGRGLPPLGHHLGRLQPRAEHGIRDLPRAAPGLRPAGEALPGLRRLGRR